MKHRKVFPVQTIVLSIWPGLESRVCFEREGYRHYQPTPPSLARVARLITAMSAGEALDANNPVGNVHLGTLAIVIRFQLDRSYQAGEYEFCPRGLCDGLTPVGSRHFD